MDEMIRPLLESYSRGTKTALDLRRRLGNATYGEVLQLLGEADLPLPRAPTNGREEELKRARMAVPQTCRVISNCSLSMPAR